jgi:mycofactocin precursor
MGEVDSRVESDTIWFGAGRGTGQNGEVRGGTMPTETLIEEQVVEIEESEELLVEEVSIDGLCGVY